MNVRLVVFDLGGVLINHEPQRIIGQLAQEARQSPEDVQRAVIDSRLLEGFELGRITPRQFFDALTTQLKLSWSFDQFVAGWNSILSENTETTWVLQRLRSRYQLAILSNTNVLHDEHVRRTWPVFSHVHHWIVSYQAGWRKPEPAIYELALRQADVPPHAAVFVDDTKAFVEEASRLGLHAIHFTDGLILEQELRAIGLHV